MGDVYGGRGRRMSKEHWTLLQSYTTCHGKGTEYNSNLLVLFHEQSGSGPWCVVKEGLYLLIPNGIFS